MAQPRKPAPLYGPPGADALGRARNRDLQLDAFPMLQGRWVEGEFAAASTLLRVNHKLGRAYLGAVSYMFLGFTPGTQANGLIIVAPEVATLFGFDPTVEVFLQRSASGTALRLRFWVF